MKNVAIKDNLANTIKYESLGKKDRPVVVWGHGWGQNRASFRLLAQGLEAFGHHVLIDFSGFGESETPVTPWSTADYADETARFIRALTNGPVIWVGHSFGCRVGLQLAARHPDLISGLFFIAGAGLKRKRPLWQNLYFKTRVLVFKFLKKLIPLGLSEEWLKNKFGSADYRNAGVMRPILVKVINEDLTAEARSVRCPAVLVYGTDDTETPPEIGERLKALIPGAELVLLEGQDHYSVLAGGRHQVAPLLKKFMEDVHNRHPEQSYAGRSTLNEAEGS